MVFPGRFSTGCLRCRQRKVKCDETKPTCRRCAIYGKPCTGYTDQFHFRHSKAKSTASTVTVAVVPAPEKQSDTKPPTNKAPARPRPNRKAKGDDHQRQQGQQHQQQQLTRSQPVWNAGIVRAPEACYDDVSLYYFVRRFVSPNPVDGFPGHLSFLPGLYDNYSHGLLETATLSVAQMAAYNKFGGEKFKVESYRNYGRAIKMMQSIIKTEEQATDDKVIASILLLCTLKDISGEESGDPNEHASGLYYLVEKRGPEQIATSRGAELLFLALIRLQVHSFLHEDSTYGDPGDIASMWGPFDPLLRAMSMMSKTLSFRHRLIKDYDKEKKHPSPQDQYDYQQQQERASTIQGCFEILDDFYIWDGEATAYWQSTFEGRGCPTALGQIASGTTHYDVETACTLILIRSARLILLMSMIAYHYQMDSLQKSRHPPPSTSEEIKSEQPYYEDIYSTGAALAALAACLPTLESDVHKTLDDMLALVPYALGQIDPATGRPHSSGSSIPHDGAAAIVIVHSIRLVASCAYATGPQMARAVEILGGFNEGMGIRAARGIKEEEEDPSPVVRLSVRSRWAVEQGFLRGWGVGGVVQEGLGVQEGVGDVMGVGVDGSGNGNLEYEQGQGQLQVPVSVLVPGPSVVLPVRPIQSTHAQFDELSPVSPISYGGRSASFSDGFVGVSPVGFESEAVYSPTLFESSSTYRVSSPW